MNEQSISRAAHPENKKLRNFYNCNSWLIWNWICNTLKNLFHPYVNNWDIVWDVLSIPEPSQPWQCQCQISCIPSHILQIIKSCLFGHVGILEQCIWLGLSLSLAPPRVQEESRCQFWLQCWCCCCTWPRKLWFPCCVQRNSTFSSLTHSDIISNLLVSHRAHAHEV